MADLRSKNGAEGFLLLTIDGVEVLRDDNVASSSSGSSVARETIGTLSVECVTFPHSAADAESELAGRDVFLVLRIAHHEFAIAPDQVITFDVPKRTFSFHGLRSDVTSRFGSERQDWKIRLPFARNPIEIEDHETLEVLLQQYALLNVVGSIEALPQPPSYESAILDAPMVSAPLVNSKRVVPAPPTRVPPVLPPRKQSDVDISSKPSMSADMGLSGEETKDYRGQLVLVDEHDGQIVGTLNEQLNLHEANDVLEKGREKDPVVIDIPEDIGSIGGTKREVWVHPVPKEQQCNIMKMSSYMSRGIVLATSAVTTGMRTASNMYISNSKPRPEPIVFSERTNRNVQRLHGFSGKAVDVTAKTTALIHEAIGKAVDYAAGGKGKGKQNEDARAGDTSKDKLSLTTRLLMSTDMLLTTVENSTKELIEHGTTRVSEAMGHKYGADMSNATRAVGESARNVGLVYIDARGVGRRALLKNAGKRYIKAKLGKKDVILGVDSRGVHASPDAQSAANGGRITNINGPSKI